LVFLNGKNGAVVATLRAFIDHAPSEVAREEAERLLGKLAAWFKAELRD
jgi:hypothetical protein